MNQIKLKLTEGTKRIEKEFTSVDNRRTRIKTAIFIGGELDTMSSELRDSHVTQRLLNNLQAAGWEKCECEQSLQEDDLVGRIKELANEICPDYPDIETCSPFEQLHAIEKSYQGLRLANDDCYRLINILRIQLNLSHRDLITLLGGMSIS